jgi:hypothetical protein
VKPSRTAYAAAWLAVALTAPAVRAQQLDPRAYTNVPVGMNFALLGYTESRGDVLPDPSLPVKDVSARVSTLVMAYARGLDLWGKSGQISLVAPYSWATVSGVIEGQFVSADRSGFGDSVVRLSMNFLGAPALSLKDFANYRQETVLGASLSVSAPLGQYDPTKLVNIGTNRWAFKPELGVSHALGSWVLEGALAVWLVTDNDQYYGGRTRSQAPLYSVQLHAVYNFRPGLWAALDYTHYTGGRSTVGGVERDDMLQNARWGATLALPVDRRNSVKLYASTGLLARSGGNFDLLGVAWQYRWGGGL